jgi:hypothetical protein
MVAIGRETRVGPVGHSAGLRGEIGSTFLRSGRIRPTLLGQHEMLSRTGATHRKRTSGIHGLA